jgi:hypothetical protein
MTYRGDTTEEWSNRYFLTGADPASSAEWQTLCEALAAEEKKLYDSTHKISRFYGYTDDAPSAAAVYTRDLVPGSLQINGTFALSGGYLPGDAAAVVRWKTSRLSVKGKPIYLRKYYHGVMSVSGQGDSVLASQVTAYNAFATLIGTGAGVGGRNLRGPGETSETFLGSSVSPWVTTRTLKRRGRRPTTP